MDDERLFKESKHKRNFKKRNRDEALLQTYVRTNDQLCDSLVARTYGYTNMYKDLDNGDVMHVEKKLGKLEERTSKVVRDIMEGKSGGFAQKGS